MEENNNTEVKEEKKNNNLVKIIIAIVVVVCLIIGLLFILNPFGGSNENKVEENTTGDNNTHKRVEFDTNEYENFHKSSWETASQVGFEKEVYNREATYAKDLTAAELFYILHQKVYEKQVQYKVEGSGVQHDANGFVTYDPGYDYLLEYEPTRKLFADYLYELVGDELEFSDDLLTYTSSDNVPYEFSYVVVEENGKKYYQYTSRTGGLEDNPIYEYHYTKVDYSDDNREAYLYEKVTFRNHGILNPYAEYTYKWTFKLDSNDNYYLYSIIRE